MQKLFASGEIKISGDFARHAETVGVLEYVIPFSEEIITEKLEPIEEFKFLEKNDDHFIYQYIN